MKNIKDDMYEWNVLYSLDTLKLKQQISLLSMVKDHTAKQDQRHLESMKK